MTTAVLKPELGRRDFLNVSAVPAWRRPRWPGRSVIGENPAGASFDLAGVEQL